MSDTDGKKPLGLRCHDGVRVVDDFLFPLHVARGGGGGRRFVLWQGGVRCHLTGDKIPHLLQDQKRAGRTGVLVTNRPLAQAFGPAKLCDILLGFFYPFARGLRCGGKQFFKRTPAILLHRDDGGG